MITRTAYSRWQPMSEIICCAGVACTKRIKRESRVITATDNPYGDVREREREKKKEDIDTTWACTVIRNSIPSQSGNRIVWFPRKSLSRFIRNEIRYAGHGTLAYNSHERKVHARILRAIREIARILKFTVCHYAGYAAQGLQVP